MNDTKTVRPRNWSRVSALLCSALLASGTGCICINVSPTGPQAGSPQQAAGRVQSGTRQTGLKDEGTPAGGNFVPVHNTLATGGSGTVCNHVVKAKYVRFSFDDIDQSLLTQTPDATVTGFQGYVEDTNTGNAVPNSEFYLQWFVNSLPQNNACATNVSSSTTDVGFTVICTALPHRFTAFFKATSSHPLANHVYKLKGNWTE